MKRFLRATILAVLFLLGGAVVTVLVAQGIGCSGVVDYGASRPQHYVAIAGKVVVVRDTPGAGWCLLDWSVEDEISAAVSQYMYDKHLDSFDGMLDKSYLHCESPDSLPVWGTFRSPENWPPERNTGGVIVRPGAGDLAVGWPLYSVSMTMDGTAPPKTHGGTLLPGATAGALRVLIWRPLMPGFLLDSLLWGACLALIAWMTRALIRRRRRTTGGCISCGYDLRGLPAAATCPECGGARTGAAGAVG